MLIDRVNRAELVPVFFRNKILYFIIKNSARVGSEKRKLGRIRIQLTCKPNRSPEIRPNFLGCPHDVGRVDFEAVLL